MFMRESERHGTQDTVFLLHGFSRATAMHDEIRPASYPNLSFALKVYYDALSEYTNPLVRESILTEGTMDEETFDVAEGEFLKFVALSRHTRLPLSVTSKQIDQVWHTYTSFTQDYTTFCKRFYGPLFHREPSLTSRPPPQRRIEDLVAVYSMVFGSMPPIWNIEPLKARLRHVEDVYAHLDELDETSTEAYRAFATLFEFEKRGFNTIRDLYGVRRFPMLVEKEFVKQNTRQRVFLWWKWEEDEYGVTVKGANLISFERSRMRAISSKVKKGLNIDGAAFEHGSSPEDFILVQEILQDNMDERNIKRSLFDKVNQAHDRVQRQIDHTYDELEPRDFPSAMYMAARRGDKKYGGSTDPM